MFEYILPCRITCFYSFFGFYFIIVILFLNVWSILVSVINLHHNMLRFALQPLKISLLFCFFFAKNAGLISNYKCINFKIFFEFFFPFPLLNVSQHLIFFSFYLFILIPLTKMCIYSMKNGVRSNCEYDLVVLNSVTEAPKRNS